MKPYFERDGITIYHGDCREIRPTADVFLTDPPYGLAGLLAKKAGDLFRKGKASYSRTGWDDTPEYVREVCVSEVERLVTTMRAGAITPGNKMLREYPQAADIGCFWTPAVFSHGPWGFTTFQPILYYGTDWRAGKGAWPSGRLLTEAAERNGHPCPKPLSAWAWLVAKVSKDGDTIIDPFCGSGTTLRAAMDLGRRAIGIEIEERYCEIAARRLDQGVLDLGA